MRAVIASFAAGLLMGAGMLVAGMVDPARVLGFFDVMGAWDPSLALVMGGGLMVTVPGFRLAQRRARPLCADAFQLPAAGRVDRRLVGGAAVFGLGWGLGGMCPGPAMATAAAGLWQGLAFVAAMVAGMLAWRLVERGLSRRAEAAAAVSA